MKKLMLLFITMVLASCFTNATETKNKGSSQFVNLSNILPAPIPGIYVENNDMTVETPDAWVQQNSSINDTFPGLGVVVMNNLQNLMWKDIHSNPTQSSLAANSILEPYRIAMETGVEVQKIPTMAIMNSSNTQRPNNNMVQWRQQFEMSTINSSATAAAIVFSRGTTVLKIWPTESFNMMADTKFAMIQNGANVCTASIVDFYNSFGSSNSHQDAGNI